MTYAHLEDKSRGFETFSIDAEGIYCSEKPEMKKFAGTQGIARDISERKRAKEALRESEEKFSGFAKASGYGFAIGKLSGQLVFGNSACLRIVEEEREADFTAKTFYQYYSEEDKKLLIEDILPTVMAKGQWKGELSLLSAKGNLTPIEQNIFLISDKHGNPQLVGNIITDITSRKEAEEALQESEERYRALFERSLELVYLCDFEGNFIDANDIALKSLGYTKKDIKSLNFSSLLVEDQLPPAIETAEEILKTGSQKDVVEFKLRRKDGEHIFVESQGVLIYRDGKPFAIQGIARNITDRKRAEEALRESEEKYRTILETIEDGYYEIDLGGNFTFFNDSMCKISGYSRDELMGMNNRQYTDEVYAKEIYQTFNKVYTTGNPDKGFDWPVIRKDGMKVTIEASISLRRNVKGEPIGFRGIAHDISERAKAEEVLRRVRENIGRFWNRILIPWLFMIWKAE